MTYHYTHYLFLLALQKTSGKDLARVIVTYACKVKFFPTEEIICRLLTDLRDGGFITVDAAADAPLTSGTSVSLTPSGQALVTLTGFHKLIGGISVRKAYLKALTETEIPDGQNTPFSMAGGEYARIVSKAELMLQEKIERSPIAFSHSRSEGIIRITFRRTDEDVRDDEENDEQAEETPSDDALTHDGHPSLAALVGGADEGDEYVRPDSLSVTDAGDGDTLCGLVSAVCDALCPPAKTRKCCLYGTEGAYVLTLAPQSGYFRIGAEPIRFNKQRFKGKRDGDLDYAQCGNVVIGLSLSNEELSATITEALPVIAPRLPEELRARIDSLQTIAMNPSVLK